MYAVDKTGLLLATDHIAWDVNLELFDEAGLSFAKIEMIKEHDKANRVCHVRYTPERPGNYLLSVSERKKKKRKNDVILMFFCSPPPFFFFFFSD